MELKELIIFTKKHAKNFLIYLCIGLGIGVGGFYFLPENHVTTGTLYITRETDHNTEFYTYSGYYSQQVALSYTKTVKGLLESEELHSATLAELEIPIDNKNLRRISNQIRIVDKGPQLLDLEIRAKDKETSRKVWESLANNVAWASKSINREGDRDLNIQRLTQDPITRVSYRNVIAFAAASGLLVLTLGILYEAIKTYMKGNE